MLQEEGLENVFARHAAPRRGDPRRGARLGAGGRVPRDPARVLQLAHRRADAGRARRRRGSARHARALRHVARRRPRQARGKVFRIGHLGDFNDLMLAGTLCGRGDRPARRGHSPRPGWAPRRPRSPRRAALPARPAAGQRLNADVTSRIAGGPHGNALSPCHPARRCPRPGRRTGARLGAHQGGGGRRPRRGRWGIGPDGPDHPEHRRQASADEAAAGHPAQGRGERRRGDDGREGIAPAIRTSSSSPSRSSTPSRWPPTFRSTGRISRRWR